MDSRTPDFRDFDTRVAAYAVLVDDGKVLLALWNEGPEPLWTMPGGGVELDETVEQAASREVLEETGYAIEVGALIGVDSNVIEAASRMDRGGRPLKNVRLVFEGRPLGGELRHEVDGTTDEARWITLNDVADLPRVALVDRAIGFWLSRT